MAWRAVTGWCVLVAALGLAGAVPAAAQAPAAVAAPDRSVVIVAAQLSETTTSFGSGWSISDRGYFVTNRHVIENGRQFAVIVDTGGGRGKSYPAEVTWASPAYDLAIVHAPDLHLPGLTMSDRVPDKGTHVIAIGYPAVADKVFTNGASIIPVSTFTEGIVGRVLHDPWPGQSRELTIIQHSAAINHGNSGGPLIDACNRVLGINTAGVVNGDGLENGVYYAADVANLIPVLPQALPGVAVNVAHGACTPGGAAAADGAGGLAPILAGSVAGLAVVVVGLAVALRRRPQIVTESYSQFVRRAFGREPDRPRPAPQPRPAAHDRDEPRREPRRPPRDRRVWKLDGATQAGAPITVRLPVAEPGEFVIGRDRAARFVIADETVSRRHAIIEVTANGLWLRDARSANGTFIDDVALGTGRQRVQPGQRLRFGKATITRIRCE